MLKLFGVYAAGIIVCSEVAAQQSIAEYCSSGSGLHVVARLEAAPHECGANWEVNGVFVWWPRDAPQTHMDPLMLVWGFRL